jgi:hypothetical protein
MAVLLLSLESWEARYVWAGVMYVISITLVRGLNPSDRRHLEMERQHRDRHRQLPDAFAVDVGADHAIAVDGDPLRVAPRDLRVRQIAAVAEVGNDLGQRLPMPDVADQE